VGGYFVEWRLPCLPHGRIVSAPSRLVYPALPRSGPLAPGIGSSATYGPPPTTAKCDSSRRIALRSPRLLSIETPSQSHTTTVIP
jgi:hypothetical protein